jgi:hypothetical protein
VVVALRTKHHAAFVKPDLAMFGRAHGSNAQGR